MSVARVVYLSRDQTDSIEAGVLQVARTESDTEILMPLQPVKKTPQVGHGSRLRTGRIEVEDDPEAHGPRRILRL